MAYHIVDRFDAFTVDEVLVIRAALATFTAHEGSQPAFASSLMSVVLDQLNDEAKAAHLEYAGVTV